MDNDNKKSYKKPKCTLIAVMVIVLLLLLGYLIIRDSRAPVMKTGGKWKAKGGCACMPPK